MLTIKQNKKPWGRTSERILQRIQNELCPAYNQAGPFGLPPLTPDIHSICREVQKICREEETKARKGFTISSSFTVQFIPDSKCVEVFHLRNKNENSLFLRLFETVENAH